MWHHHHGSSHWCQWTPNLDFRVFFRHYSAADRIVFVEPDRNLIFRRNWFRLIECFSVRSRKKVFEPSSRWSIGDQSLNQNLNGDAFFDRKTTQAAKVAPTHFSEWHLSKRLLPAHNNGKNTICGFNIRHKNCRSSILLFGAQIARK